MRLNKNQRLRGRINLINTQRLAPKEMHSHQQSALKRLYVTLCSLIIMLVTLLRLSFC